MKGTSRWRRRPKGGWLLLSILVALCSYGVGVDGFRASRPPFLSRTPTSLHSSSSSPSSSSSSSSAKEGEADDDDMIGFKITMPELSKTMKKGRIVMWLKDEGDYIEAGEALVVVDTDKADVEMEGYQSGYVAKLLLDEGEAAEIGDPIALIASTEDGIDAVVDMYEKDGGASLQDAISAGR